jgi:GDP-D-mannose dehydratase
MIILNYLEIDEAFYRPSEVYALKGDSTKAKKELGWKHEVSFESLVAEMVKSDMEYFQNTTQTPSVVNHIQNKPYKYLTA